MSIVRGLTQVAGTAKGAGHQHGIDHDRALQIGGVPEFESGHTFLQGESAWHSGHITIGIPRYGMNLGHGSDRCSQHKITSFAHRDPFQAFVAEADLRGCGALFQK